MDIDAFTITQVGTTGHEVRDPDGNVIAWTATEPWAMVIAAALSHIEAERFTGHLQGHRQ
jgi:hypothetical protein